MQSVRCQARYVAFIAFFVISSGQASSSKFDDYFSVVFVNAQTESKYGPVPLNRNYLADAINLLADAGARGVVLKFFLDLSQKADGDQRLANSLRRLPVVLQARLDHGEPNPNKLPERFTLNLEVTTALSGSSGWIPKEQFSDAAHDIGFIDFHAFPISLFERYKGQTVKSLFICSLELATGKPAAIKPTSHLEVGNIKLTLGALNETEIKPTKLTEINYIPFHDVLETEEWRPKVKDKVVILGYDGENIHKIETDHGPIPAHRLFVHVLQAMVENDT